MIKQHQGNVSVAVNMRLEYDKDDTVEPNCMKCACGKGSDKRRGSHHPWVKQPPPMGQAATTHGSSPRSMYMYSQLTHDVEEAALQRRGLAGPGVLELDRTLVVEIPL